jgi:acylphosphatase
MSRKCLKSLVSGRVQGVWYRASTRDRALALGVVGYVKNLADGRVEVLACGDTLAVDALVGWLAQGPPRANVRDVSTQAVDGKWADGLTSFEVR